MFYYKIIDKFDKANYCSAPTVHFNTEEEAWHNAVEHYRALSQIFQDGYRFTIKVFREEE